MNRHPLFLLTDEEYGALGAVDVENGRWIARDAGGAIIFNRKDYHGAEQASKKIGLFVSSSWYEGLSMPMDRRA